METLNLIVERENSKDEKKINLKEVEKILKNIREYEVKVRGIELEIADLKDLQSIGLKGISYDNLVQTNSLFSKTEFQAIKSLEIQQTIDLLKYNKRHLERFLKRIKNAIESLTDIEKQIIEMKCMENQLWRSITIKVNLEERQCREIKKRALKRIAKLIMNRDIIILD